MANISDRHQPSFVNFPLQNSRTALQPVNMPLLLVVPHVRATNGQTNQNHEISNLKYFIEDAPGLVPVAGYEHEGIFVPDFLRFERQISNLELSDCIIILDGLQFYDGTTNELKNYIDAVDGDYFEYVIEKGITESSGPRDKIIYYKDANYYDLSRFALATAELKPYGNYKFSWTCNYYNRIITPEGELFCIDANDVRLARFSILMAHPGEIHQMMLEQTPTVYFDGAPLDKDNLTKFYRPFADALQDIFDEQKILHGINFLERIPAQFMPYLAYLVGWDLPYFNGATDTMRRAILRNARHLQQLKGSRRAIRELFELFGYTIDVVNLWYNKSGTEFIGPDDSEEITTTEVCQTEVLLSEYATDGFGKITIPLLFRPNSNMTIDAWLVESGSTADQQMQELMEAIDVDPEGLMGTVCLSTNDFLISQPLTDSITEPTIGHSKILVSQRLGSLDEDNEGVYPLSKYGVKYDYDKNLLEITFDHYIDFSNIKLYAFATYKRTKIVTSPDVKDLRSNRFDIRVLYNNTTGDTPSSQLFEFLLDFIFKIKAFHSLLRKISFNVDVTDVYAVTDFCLGGTISQLPGTSMGELQTIPPVTPTGSDGCDESYFKRGFKDSDLALRNTILNGLKEEHAAWKALDGTHIVPNDPIYESLQRVQTNVPDDGTCQFNKYGQDRVVDTDIDLDHNTDTRDKVCSETTSTNCFTGRVKGEIKNESVLSMIEYMRCSPCSLTMGNGVYYENDKRDSKQGTMAIDHEDQRNINKSMLSGMLIRMANGNRNLCFTDSDSITDLELYSNDHIAIRRPPILITHDNMFMPGHRFVSMANLENDRETVEYTFRPWDDIFDACPEDLSSEALYIVTNINASISQNTTGDDILTFNDFTFKTFGNGISEDISSMGSHLDTDFVVTHSIFSNNSDNGIDFGADVTLTTLSDVCFAGDYGKIFNSASTTCGCDNPTQSFAAGNGSYEGADFIDGYPSAYNRYNFNIDEYDYYRGNTDDVDLGYILGLPNDTSVPTTAMFMLGSGILLDTSDVYHRYHTPYRLDCGCSLYQCNPTSDDVTSVQCMTSLFLDENGDIEPDCDKITVEQKMIFNESYGTCGILVGAYPTSAATDRQHIQTMFDVAFNGDSFKYVDDYGIIYKYDFIRDDTRIDITDTVCDPRLWGSDQMGYINDGRVYRTGPVTTTRTISQGDGITNAVILSSGAIQTIDTFQSTFKCGDEFPDDKFVYHMDCGIVDDIEFDIVCGPSYDDAWCEIVEDSSGNVHVVVGGTEQCIYYVDVWENDEVISTICP